MEVVLRILVLLFFLVCASNPVVAQPLYPNSIASNNLDFIKPDDPGACWDIAETGSGRTEMYDRNRDTLFVDDALHFDVNFDSQTIRINVHPGVKAPPKRATEAAESLSRLPNQMRQALNYVNILDGDGGAWAEDKGRFITLHDGLMALRLSEHDLDETVFHEAAHVALDPVLSNDADWKSNQAADNGFITQYAAKKPNKEDIAESALFAWTLLNHSGRLPAAVEKAVRKTMPNRLEYLGNMLDGFEPPSCAK